MTAEPAPRRIDLAHAAAFRLGGLEVRPAAREIVAGPFRQILEPRIMQVLVALAGQRGEVVSRDDLIDQCWGGRIVGDDAIDRCIGALRRLAEAHGGFAIETIPRVGYRLTEQAPQAGGRGLRGRLARHWRMLAAAAAVVLVLAGAVGWLTLGRAERPRDFNDVRVAVLPFDALSPGPDTALFADSLRDEIVSVLARNQVQVVPRRQSLALKGDRGRSGIDRLKVGLVLDGDVERRGEVLRVRVHLEDPKAETTLWSRVFEGPASDPAVVQTRAAGRATDVIGWLLSNRYGLGAPIDRATLSAYLEAGDEIQNQGGERFLTIFRQIVARAPDFSYGHSGLGYALARAGAAAPAAERLPLLDEARREATTALRLDPQNGEAYALMAVVAPPLAWASRERLLSTGLAADPNSWAVPAAYASLLADLGRGREALALAQRAVAVAPYWARGRALLARRLADVGRLAEARAELARAARLWPDDPDVIRIQGQLAAESGPPAAAVPTAPRLAVAVLARRGDLDAAFAEAERLGSLEGADDTYGYQDATSVLFAPVAAPMRRDPRFLPLATRLGLVDDWRRTAHWPDFCKEPGRPDDCASLR